MKRNNSYGVTIIELIIVLSVISVTTAISYPRFSDYLQRRKLDGSVQILTIDLLLARQQAVSRGNDFVVNIFNGSNTYVIFEDVNSDRSRGTNEYTLGPRGVPVGVDITGNTFSNSQAIFYPDGKATPGDVTLSNTQSLTHKVNVYYTGAVRNDL
jgi:type IV fimbrial biogenesis protein FimT